MAAEDVLHDIGAISIMSSDSQAMGRCGEVIVCTRKTAHLNKPQRGALLEDKGTGADNHRVKRYISKYTINPALAQGINHAVGNMEVGKLADMVLWEPSDFGVEPCQVIKKGFIAFAQMVCLYPRPAKDVEICEKQGIIRFRSRQIPKKASLYLEISPRRVVGSVRFLTLPGVLAGPN